MCSDEALAALANQHKAKDREELGARNSQERPETHNEVVARVCKHNDVVFFTEESPDLHCFFGDMHDLDFQDMPGGEMTAEDAKKKIAEARAKLVQVSHSTE